METHRTIYTYESARQFLIDYLAEKQRTDSSFSIRKWAKEMGLKSHTLLLMLLQGKRPLRAKHTKFLTKGVKLGAEERLYLQALIQFENAGSEEEKRMCSIWLSDLHPSGQKRIREIAEFEAISHWVHTAILAMTETKTFSADPKSIAARLRGGLVSESDVRAAIDRLLDLKLLAKTEDGKLVATCEELTTKNDLINLGGRRYHAMTIDLARKAVEEVAVELREFQSFSLSVPHDRIGLAKDLIRKFKSQFARAMGDSGTGDEVYQMNMHFFPLTQVDAQAVREKSEKNETAATEAAKEPLPC